MAGVEYGQGLGDVGKSDDRRGRVHQELGRLEGGIDAAQKGMFELTERLQTVLRPDEGPSTVGDTGMGLTPVDVPSSSLASGLIACATRIRSVDEQIRWVLDRLEI